MLIPHLIGPFHSLSFSHLTCQQRAQMGLLGYQMGHLGYVTNPVNGTFGILNIHNWDSLDTDNN